jgi:integrase
MVDGFGGGSVNKSLVHTLIEKNLSPKSITAISSFVRVVVVSAVDPDGNQAYPRTWNLDFVDAPPVRKQSQPTVTKEFLQAILRDKRAKVRNRVLLALLASTGMRIGELLALQIDPDPSDQNSRWDSDARMIRVRKSVWRGKLQDPKTAAAVRDIELSVPTNKMLLEYAMGRHQGEFLFCAKSGKPLHRSHITKFVFKPLGIPGAHSLRRFRVSHLREVGCNEDILKAWLGHTNGSDITNRYSKVPENLELRRTWAERVGTGIELSSVTGDPGNGAGLAHNFTPDSAGIPTPSFLLDTRGL